MTAVYNNMSNPWCRALLHPYAPALFMRLDLSLTVDTSDQVAEKSVLNCYYAHSKEATGMMVRASASSAQAGCREWAPCIAVSDTTIRSIVP